MSAEFDPYQEWLSIPPDERPANYYRLLGLPLFESNANVISNAADRQMAFVRTFQTGQYSQQSQQILNELAQARVTLLDKRKKADYDAKLRAEQKSGSNGGIGVVSSLGSYGEVQSAPPPSAASLTPQPWSNAPQGVNPGIQSHVTPPGGITAAPPVPNPPNRSELTFAFLKKHWIVILSAFVALQLIICGTGLLAYLLKPSKTEIAQNAAEQPQNVDEGTKDDSQPSDAAQLAKRYYEQSVDLQEKEEYDEALIRINVAVELQPNNELYKVQQKALTRLKSSAGKAKTPPAPDATEDKLEQNESAPVPDIDDKPISTQPERKPQVEEVKRPARTSMTPEEAKAKLEAEAKAMFDAAEEESPSQMNAKRRAEAVYNEAVALQKQGKYIQAAEKLNDALKLDPDNEQYKEEKSEFEDLAKAEESYNESVDLEEKEQYAEALVKIEDALAIDPNNEDFIKEKLNIQTGYYKQYVEHRIQREYPQALEKIDKAVELVPKEEFYKEEKQKTEELVKAVEEGKELPEKDPDYGEPEEAPEEPVVEQEPEKPRGFEPGKEAGERKTVDVDGVEIAFRWCPPGTFIMGSPTSEANRKADEKQHEVILTKGFWIMETQITVGMFKAFVNDTGYQSKGLTPWGLSNGKWKQDAGYSWLNPGFAQSDDSPVTCISWRDAAAFSKWLGSKIESKTKLPTEAQWEYACRAGSTSAYFWGSSLNGDRANCNGNYPYGTTVKGLYQERTVPVRNYQRNAWGVYDMHGNVWEWCLDGYAAYPNGKVTNPFTPGNGTNRVFRGGSWSYFAERCRSAFRASDVPVIRLPNLGGRCVVEPSDAAPVNASIDKNAGKRAVKTINGVEFAFRYCPPGTFMMGSPSSEKGRNSGETQHQVTLTKGFWMLETEVTQKQWKAVMGTNPSNYKGDDLPVEQVSWNACQEFCKKCKSLGLPVQLPTEAQWEYACRAGTTGAYAGDLNEMAWYSSNSGSKTHPVGTKKPNAWGLYDMHGNVWEWCQDWYDRGYPSGSVTDPVGPKNGFRRVNRGGSWDRYAHDCRSASRSHYGFDNRYTAWGFRCVSSLDLESSMTEGVKSTDGNNDKESVEPVNANVDKNAGKRAVKTINGVEFAFRYCPPGTFMMGSPSSDEGRYSNETQHQVTLTKGFWMMETEVTQKQWKAVMGTNPSKFKGDDLPVEQVSWNDCQEFCKKCTKLGLPVQLPTEAQWEYACRAGTTGAYAGNLDEMAWYNESYAKGSTHPVGTKKPNAWGLYDMHGNVWEWCQDRYDRDYPSGSVTDPVGPKSGSARVDRGGGWNSIAGYCRSAGRSSDSPEYRGYSLGFRCVRSITRPEN